MKLFVQIETQKAVDAVEEICAVPELTGVIVGPNDLLGDLGLPGQSKHPVLRDVIKRVFETAKAHGLSAGTITGDKELLEYAIVCGADVVSVNSDIGYLLRGAEGQLGELGLARSH